MEILNEIVSENNNKNTVAYLRSRDQFVKDIKFHENEIVEITGEEKRRKHLKSVAVVIIN